MVEIWKLQRVTNKKHRRVVTDQIPVTLLRIELQGKSANVALGVCSTALTGNRGKPSHHIGRLAHF